MLDQRHRFYEHVVRDEQCTVSFQQAGPLRVSIYRQLRTQGTPIPTNDMWLAALVPQHNLGLHARDAHLDYLPQIVRV